MINYELKLPATNKTKDQIAREWMIDKAKRPSSDGYYDKFKKKIMDARKKDEAVAKEKKRMNVLDWIDSNVAMYEPENATDKQKAVLKRIQDETKSISQRTESNKGQRMPESMQNLEILKNNINNRVATKPTEENLYEVWLEMKKAGELPNMNFKEFEIQFPNLDIDITKKKKPISTHTSNLWSNIKNSSIYKLLENEKLLGTELGHESLIELIHLAQNYGIMKKGGRVK